MSIIYRGKRGRGGFTAVELICVLAVLAVLAAVLVPAAAGWIEKANVTRYVSETRGVCDSVRLYAIDTYGGSRIDAMEMMEELTGSPLDSEKNPLHSYLLTECSKDAVIENLTLNATHSKVVGIVYLVDRYRIEIDEGNVSVTPRR